MKFSKKSSKSGVVKEVKDSLENLGIDLVDSGKSAVIDSLADVKQQLFGVQDAKAAKPDPFKLFENSNLPPGSFPENFFDQERVQKFKEPARPRKIEVVFNRQEMLAQRSIENEIHQLMQVVRTEIEMLKVEDKALINDLSKLSLSETPKTPGVYHVRFLEFVIRLLKAVRQKISESRMWLQTSMSRRKAKSFRGLAKKHGTSFSMSKELSQANAPG